MSKVLRVLTHACVCIVISMIVIVGSRLVHSDYLQRFFDANLILLLVALLAINTTTISVIMTKLRELSSSPEIFKRTRRELRVSVIEQLVLIGTSAVVLVLGRGSILNPVPHSAFVVDTLLLAVFCYALYILYDTAEAVFVIIGFEEDKQDMPTETDS